MPDVELPDEYRARPATMEDAGAVARVVSACEVAYGLGTQTSAADIRDDWQSLDLAKESVIIEDADGTVVAETEIINRQFSVLNAYGYVHPDHEGQGLGRFLVDWVEGWATERMSKARPDVQVVVRHFVNANNHSAIDLFEDCGYEHVRNTYVMDIQLNEPPPGPDWPDGVIPAEYRPGTDELAIHEAVEDAFRDTWGRPPSTYERFLQFSKSEGVKSDLWITAWAGDQVAGVFLGMLTSNEGWVPTVGVRRAWRRKGLGLALLRAGFGAFYRRGITDIRLSVDAKSLTGATRLYERAGMEIVSNYALYQKMLRDGIDLSEEAAG